MASPAFRDEFCLYLWRSVETPGTLYMARNMEHAKAVFAGLIAEGYIVRAVHAATDIEYALCEGQLLPAPFRVEPAEVQPPRSQRNA